MGFERTRFNNFRNIEPREIKWYPGLNLLTGKNGSGKTNILEGINIISGWGPLERGTRTVSLPTWDSGSNEMQLTGQLDGENGEIIKVKISDRYYIKLEEKLINASELRWKIPVLSFLPNDMTIIESSASYRRRLLDMILALLIPPYAARLHDYRRGIKQKAVLLHKGSPTDIIDRALLPLVAWIWKMREECTSLLSECIKEIDFTASFNINLFLKRGGAGLLESTEDDYRNALSINRNREIMLKTPLIGPHRDDLIIQAYDGKPASESLSRGYRRLTAIALILAASDSVYRKLGKEPLLLLDEVTAELDTEGRKFLFDSLIRRKAQVFAATAEQYTEVFPGNIYNVNAGRVEKINEY